RFLWCQFFDATYKKRQQLQKNFWQTIEQGIEQHALPKQAILFTVQQLPPNELDELRKLSRYMPVTLLHFNPSEQFWADIV
ncbi:exodeoxyribonuclease V subunit gamma, partial [Burkholderia mallei]